jgi:Ca-activated chloride channel family protein
MELIAMASLHFLRPLWLLTLPFLLCLAAWCWRARRGDGAWAKMIDPELLPMLRIEKAKPAQSPWSLLALAWTLAVLALASPSWQRRATTGFQASRGWVLVLDLSPTMSLADVTPDRVTRARYAISDLLAAAHDARVGLVVYSGEAHTVTPLTSDVATVRTLLQPLAPKLMPESGDNVTPALEEASRLLQAAHLGSGQVVVLSDGFADPARAMLAAKRMREEGAVVNVIGIGTAEGAPTADETGKFVRDARGHTVMARLQTDELQRLAAAGGGRYFSLDTMSSLIQFLQEHRDLLPHADTKARRSNFTIWLNGGFWLLPPLLLLAALMARRGWL